MLHAASQPIHVPKHLRWLAAIVLACCSLCLLPATSLAASDPKPIYQTLDELEGKTFAYVNGSVYDQKVQEKVANTKSDFYPSLPDCVAAVEAGKADAAVQLSYCCELVVNRKNGTVALLPEKVADVQEAFFFPHGDPLVEKFNQVINKFEADGTLDKLAKKWVEASEDKETLPEQDWDAPNGTLKFATSGVIEPFSYVGKGGQPMGYDVELALLIAKELGYKLDISTITMDAIFASVQSGKVDFGGTLTRTDERAKAVDFSEQVMPCYVSVIVPAEESSGGGLEMEHLSDVVGKTVGVMNGGVYDQLVQQNVPGDVKFAYYNTTADMVAALNANKIDAFAADGPVAQLAVNQNEGIGIMPEEVTKDKYGFFFKKGSELTDKFSEVITKLNNDGTLQELRDKWTGADDSVKTLPEQDWDAPNGTLTMMTSGLQEPLTYASGNQIVGYDIEVALLCCKELGYKLDVKSGDISSAIAAVEAGKADFGGGGISITEERAEQVDFTVPDYDSACVLVVRAEAEPSAVEGFFASIADSFRKTFIEENRWELIVSGLGVTVLISVCAGVLGVLLGFATVLARRSNVKLLHKLVNGYSALMGGIPLVVVLMVLYYVVFGSFNIAGEIVAIIAFTLTFGAAAGATMWTAVESIDVIQEETGLALGYTRKQVFRKIIFPQAMQQFLPQLMGQFVSLVKDTSIVGYIAVQDLTRASDLIRSRTMDAFFPLIATAIIYFVVCRLLALLLEKLTAKLDVTNRPRKIEGIDEA